MDEEAKERVKKVIFKVVGIMVGLIAFGCFLLFLFGKPASGMKGVKTVTDGLIKTVADGFQSSAKSAKTAVSAAKTLQSSPVSEEQVKALENQVKEPDVEEETETGIKAEEKTT